jgi:localization factor PodJL
MGLADSRYNLGVMYMDGRGVKQDLVTAYFWLHLAALQGDKNASVMRDSIAGDMSSAQMAEASALIRERK